MTFASLGYLTFLLLFLPLCQLTPPRFRWIPFIVASYYFYGCWNAKYSLLMLASTLLSFWGASWAAPRHGEGLRRAGLFLGVGLNLAILAVFKYWNFFRVETGQVTGWFGWNNPLPVLEVLLPVGISFYTFQALSYVIDVYRGQYPQERHLGWYTAYISFFPQLVAGPIERAGHLLGQLKTTPVKFREEDLKEGFRWILYGLVLKLVVADNLGALVDQIAKLERINLLKGLLLMHGFGFQIYFDFYAYSVLAIGSARLFGVQLMDNFRRPYMAGSIREFWHRWHISLTTWFRDYVYLPLGGNRVSPLRWKLNIAAVFLLSGLWHGAALTFLIWGAGHAVLYLAGNAIRERPLGQRIRSWPIWLRRLAVAQLVGVLWLVFRAPNLEELGRWIGGMIKFKAMLSVSSIRWDGGIIAGLILAGCWLGLEGRAERGGPGSFHNLSRPWRWGCYMGATALVLIFGRFGTGNFIYFQF
jgi:D-alanyl-lipoteichoic acid acyltransferase DltB (MBOAT superfamily)